MPPRPGGVAMATMVSSRFTGPYLSLAGLPPSASVVSVLAGEAGFIGRVPVPAAAHGKRDSAGGPLASARRWCWFRRLALVGLGVDHNITLQSLAGTLGAQVLGVAERKVQDTTFA